MESKLVNLRDHMANERTFLAWVRTSLGIMAFGFVVEKFSLFIKQIAAVVSQQHLQPISSSHSMQGYSAVFGIILVGLGAFIALFAFIKYKKVAAQIEQNTYQPTTLLDLTLTLSIILIGVFLVVYLISSI